MLYESRCKKDNQGWCVFHLKDYLGPNEKYPYKQLFGDLESARACGNNVSLISVPGFVILNGFADLDEKENRAPWFAYGEAYESAREALGR